MKPKPKNPDPVQRNPELEAQMQAAIDNPSTLIPAPTQDIVQVGDARVEQIKKANGGYRLAVRAANGKFTKMTTAVAARDACDAQNFLAEKVKDEVGNERTRKAHLREALYTGAIKGSQSDKGLGPAVKAFEALNEDAALTQTKESMVQAANQEVNNPVRVVVINSPVLMHPEIVEFDKRPEKPRQPSFAEVTSVETNPR